MGSGFEKADRSLEMLNKTIQSEKQKLSSPASSYFVPGKFISIKNHENNANSMETGN